MTTQVDAFCGDSDAEKAVDQFWQEQLQEYGIETIAFTIDDKADNVGLKSQNALYEDMLPEDEVDMIVDFPGNSANKNNGGIEDAIAGLSSFISKPTMINQFRAKLHNLHETRPGEWNFACVKEYDMLHEIAVSFYGNFQREYGINRRLKTGTPEWKVYDCIRKYFKRTVSNNIVCYRVNNCSYTL